MQVSILLASLGINLHTILSQLLNATSLLLLMFLIASFTTGAILPWISAVSFLQSTSANW